MTFLSLFADSEEFLHSGERGLPHHWDDSGVSNLRRLWGNPAKHGHKIRPQSNDGELAGGPGTHNIFGWGCDARSWKPLPYFRPKYPIFHTLFQTWLLKCMPYFRPCGVWQCRQLSIDLRRTGLRDAPNDVRVFFLREKCLLKHTLL